MASDSIAREYSVLVAGREMSGQAAMTDESTINTNDINTMGVMRPLNHRSSPYAMRMMVKFLKIV